LKHWPYPASAALASKRLRTRCGLLSVLHACPSPEAEAPCSGAQRELQSAEAQGGSHVSKRSGVFRHWPYPASAGSLQASGCVPTPACLWISSLQKATPLPESRKARRLAGSKQLCSKIGPASSNIAAGAMAVERIACSGAMTGRSAVQWRAMQRGGGSGAKRSCRTERSGGRPLRSSSLLVV